METKICNKCKVEKEFCEFNIDSRSKSGRQASCKLCRKKYNETNSEKNKIRGLEWRNNHPNYSKNYSKQYYINNKEKIKESNKNYYENNKENISKSAKIYYEENKEVIKSKVKTHRNNNIINAKILEKKYRESNPKKIKERKEIFKKKNPTYHNDYLKKRRENDVLYKLISLNRNRIRTFIKNKNITKQNKTFDIVGCTPEFLKEHIEKQFTEGMSWTLMGKYIHIDHIIPLSSAKTEEEIYKLCHYTNLQPLWAKDNLRKSNKILL